MEELSKMKMPSRMAKPGRQTRWQRPDEGWLKVNTDATFDSSSCTGHAGVVIRDHLGLVKEAAARWLDDVSDALTFEAMAAKEGLAVENGYDRVILEIDCRGLQTLLEDSFCVRSVIGGLCFDITELSRSFIDFRVKWVCREANSVANYYASMVSVTERSLFWLDYVPYWLMGLAAADCTPVTD
jgi:hypothetical protein